MKIKIKEDQKIHIPKSSSYNNFYIIPIYILIRDTESNIILEVIDGYADYYLIIESKKRNQIDAEVYERNLYIEVL